MRVAVRDVKFLKMSVKLISDLVDEAVIAVSKDGMSLLAMDPSRIAIVEWVMGPGAFGRSLETDLKEGETRCLPLDLEKFSAALQKTSDRTELWLEDESGLENGISKGLTLLQDGGAARIVRFRLPFADIKENGLKTPKWDLPAELRINPAFISEGIEAAEFAGLHLTFKVDAGGLEIIGSKDGKVEASMQIGREAIAELKAPEGRTIRSMFSIDYLKGMPFKEWPEAYPGQLMTLLLAEKHPMKAVFPAPNGQIAFMLAPRIE